MNWTRGKIIGRGSTATVSAATLQESGETIAVKSAEFHRSEFLQREAKILSSLNSPHVIGYRGCQITKESFNNYNGEATTYNLLMEYAPYGTLADVASKNGGSIDETRVVEYTRQILLGLEYIHNSMGIAHCDIKGSNVLVGDNGEAKIADFGCAKRDEPERTEPVRGTPAFMAPEVARGERQGKESDIWAMGCTVIEMVTGSTPWSGADSNDPVSVLYRVGYLGESPELPCSLTEQAKDFLGKCLKKDAKERWTASQLLNHPFLITKPDNEPELVTGLVTNSPTSVTDQMFWRSVEEDHPSWWECHEDERIGVLSWTGQFVVESTWDTDGADWITVRTE
ncbi:PREDICTED: mitogen-activated protein kinase kinase kinase ANP1-like [Camelina sativa]|uniref:Mitogen-activated protein kinase kinase kinase ANP1-like n=1 Tax=Camelina sativa TaxID=90675 RepID=A0ABM0VKH9_CAMSA|nr:PREDICTED: mitogen-activated protein kinase kinase kinase ANP1-like [Camelina sativa]